MSMYNTVAVGNAIIDTDCPNPVTFGRTIDLGATSTDYGDIRIVGGAFQFRLSDCAGSTDFTNLFDQYKISGVKVRIWWTSTSSDSATRVPAPRMIYSVDEDDNEVPTDLNGFRQKNSVKVHQFGNGVPLQLYIKPRLAKSVYNNSVSTAYSSTRSWVDCQNSNVPHYGLKFFLQDVWAPNDIAFLKAHMFRVETTYYIKAKGVQ